MANESPDKDDNVTYLRDAPRKIPAPANDGTQGGGEPMFNLPPAVKFLSLCLLAVYGLMKLVPMEQAYNIVMSYGFIPARYTGGDFGFDALVSPLAHMFLHADFLHLAINVGTLLAFGAGVERALGAKKLLILYFASGLCGAFAHFFFYPHLQGPLIGASGAISGLFAGVLIFMQLSEGKTNLRGIAPFALIWIGISVFFGFFGMPGVSQSIGWAAHVGGFVGGLVLFKPIMRLKID